jgi:hypothetical protein
MWRAPARRQLVRGGPPPTADARERAPFAETAVSNVDVQQASEVYARIVPLLAEQEAVVFATDPAMTRAEVLERAMRVAIARLGVQLSRETFEYLHSKVESHRMQSSALRDARQTRPRIFRDGSGALWTVLEVEAAGMVGARGPRCLVFECGAAVRRVWHYPAEWGEWNAEKLEALSWET